MYAPRRLSTPARAACCSAARPGRRSRRRRRRHGRASRPPHGSSRRCRCAGRRARASRRDRAAAPDGALRTTTPGCGRRASAARGAARCSFSAPIPPIVVNDSSPLSSMFVIATPISSMWPTIASVGAPSVAARARTTIRACRRSPRRTRRRLAPDARGLLLRAPRGRSSEQIGKESRARACGLRIRAGAPSLRADELPGPKLGAHVILLIDNYDSFTYNLAHLFGELGAEVVVRRNDEIDAGRGGAARPVPPRRLPRPGPARGGGRDAGDPRRLCRPGPDARRVPRPPGARRSCSAARSDRRASSCTARRRPSRTTAAASSPACRKDFVGGPLPLARGDVGARRVRGLGDRRRRRGDGRTPPRAADRRRPVPPRVGADAARPRHRARTSSRYDDDPGRARPAARRQGPDARRGAPRDGRDHVGRGDAGADRRLPRRAAPEGRDRRRDRGRRGGDARARDRGASRSATTSSTPPAPAATAARRSTSRPPPRSSPRRPAQASRSTATARSRRSPGSADVLEALGFELDLPPERIAQSIDELGFGFMFAPTHHPAMKHAGPVRRELAARTVFNVLGPLTNPAGARAQVVGVYSPELVPVIADVLAQARRAPRVRRARRGRHRRALARRPEPRLRGRRRRRARGARSTRSTSASPRCDPDELRGGDAGRERADDPRGLRTARTAGGARRSC